MKTILSIFLLLMLGGCGSKVPVATMYKIDTKSNIQSNNAQESSECKNKSLKVMQTFSSNLLMSKEMNYVVDSNQVYPYSTAQWAITPNRVVSDEYFKMLRELNIFSSVGNSKSRSKASWLLETRVEDFMQYYENGNDDSHVKVAINLTIVDSKSSNVIASNIFKSNVTVDTLNAQGGVEALNKALADVLSQSANWLIEECK